MQNSIKYAITIKESSKQSLLYVGTSKKKGEPVSTVQLDSNFPANHIKNREVIDNMMTKANIIPMTMNFQQVDSDTQLLWGECINRPAPSINRRGPYKKKTSEEGFSLIELAVSCAIMAALSAVALSYYLPLHDKIIGQIEDIKTMQAANPEVQYLVEFN